MVIYILFFLSGFSSLLYQIVWAKYFSIYFGSTFLSTTSILASFMTGLALGSFLGGRVIDKKWSPLKTYGTVEYIIGISSILVFFVTPYYSSLYLKIYSSINQVAGLHSYLMVPFIFSLVIIPTTLMGSTYPVLCKYMISIRKNVGKVTGLLYLVNTFGAAVGCFLVGFISIPFLGLTNTNYLGVVINIIIGSSFFILFNNKKNTAPKIEITEPHKKKKKKVLFNPIGHIYSNRIQTVLLIFCGLIGFSSMAYEVLWLRLFIPLFKGTVYSFTTILTCVLVGIACGGGIYNRLLSRKKDQVYYLGITQIFIGLYAFYMLIVYPFINITTVPYIRDMNWLYEEFNKFIIIFLVLLIPTTLIGIAFPMIASINSNEFKKVGKSIGDTFSINTVGSIFGALITGFFLIPLLGLKTSISSLGFLSICLGIVSLIFSKKFDKKNPEFIIVVTIIVSVILFFKSNKSELVSLNEGEKLIYYNEDNYGNISIIQNKNFYNTLVVNNNVHGGNDRRLISDERGIGVTPLIFHRNPEKVLLVGVGTGIPLESVSKLGHDVEGVEIVPTLISTMKYFVKNSESLLSNKKVKVAAMDGRYYLIANEKKYDVIISDLFHPEISGAGDLFSFEHVENVKNHLKENGIFAQWVPLYQFSEKGFKSLMKTYSSVFDNIVLWQGSYNPEYPAIVLICSKSPIKLNYMELSKKLKHISKTLKFTGGESVDEFMSNFIATSKQLEPYYDKSKINTNLNRFIESTSPKKYSVRSGIGYKNLTTIYRDPSPIGNILIFDHGKKLIIRKIASLVQTKRHFMASLRMMSFDDIEGAEKEFREGLLLNRESTKLAAFIYMTLGNYYLKIKPNRAEKGWKNAITIDPELSEAYQKLAMFDLVNGRLEKAIQTLQAGIDNDKLNPEIRLVLARLLEEKSESEKAIKLYEEAININPYYALAYYYLGNLYKNQGENDKGDKIINKGMLMRDDLEKLYKLN